MNTTLKDVMNLQMPISKIIASDYSHYLFSIQAMSYKNAFRYWSRKWCGGVGIICPGLKVFMEVKWVIHEW